MRADGRILGVRDPRKQDHEFIPALAAHGVRLPPASDQALCDRLQQFVADEMSHRVVDALEAIQVQKQYRELLVVAFRGGDSLLDAVGQQHAVGQAGEKVVLG